MDPESVEYTERSLRQGTYDRRFACQIKENGTVKQSAQVVWETGKCDVSGKSIPDAEESAQVYWANRRSAGPARSTGAIEGQASLGDLNRACPPTRIRDVGEAGRILSSVGIKVRFNRITSRGSFSLDLHRFRLGATDLVCTTWGTDVWSTVELQSRVAVVVNPVFAKPSTYTTSEDCFAASATVAPILPPGRRIEVFRPALCPVVVLSAKVTDLGQRLQRVTGMNTGSPNFDPVLNRRSPEGRRLQRLLDFVMRELSEDPSLVHHPISRRQLDDLILDGILSLPGSHYGLVGRSISRESVASAVVRRAEKFMEANIDRPISISDVAAECYCSRTKLFQAFKRERDWTPLQFLVRRRMERARRRLLAPCEGMTVTSIALESGYVNLSRFAGEYRKVYGETPSATLHGGG